MKLLVENGTILRPGQQLDHHHILVEDQRIHAVVAHVPADFIPDETIDATGCAVIPGLINTHHHLFQSLTRCLPSVQNAKLFDWLTGLYEVWRPLDYQALKTASQISLAEMLLSGCTTTNDMMYLFPRGADVALEAVLEAASELGIRLHAGRGSMAIGKSQGSLAPDVLTQDEPAILKDCERVLHRFHDQNRYAMARVDLMPCAPFSISLNLFKETRQLARAHNALCHTHVAETLDEEIFCLHQYGKRPVDYVMDAGWSGPDVSFAHCVCLNAAEIKLLADTKTAVAHCPSSNMILGSGIPPVCELLRAGATVGLGVDGSSSNHGGHVLAEARQALLLQRVKNGAESFTAADAFRLVTTGGAMLLNRADELGDLAPGYAADLAIFDLQTIEYAGAAVQDPLATLMMCHAGRAKHVIVNGRVVVKHGRLATMDESTLVARMNELVQKKYR